MKQPNSYNVTRYNATKHGVLSHLSVLPWEDPMDLETLQNEFLKEYDPQGTTERYLVLELANIVFRKQRVYKAEQSLAIQQVVHICPFTLTDMLQLTHPGFSLKRMDIKKSFAPEAQNKQDIIELHTQTIEYIQELINFDGSYEKMLKECDPEILDCWNEHLLDEESCWQETKESFIEFLQDIIIDFNLFRDLR